MGDSPVLSMCVVRDKVWMGFEIGYLIMFDTMSKRPHVQVHVIVIAPTNVTTQTVNMNNVHVCICNIFLVLLYYLTWVSF